MLSLLRERQVLPPCCAVGLDGNIVKRVGARKRKKIPFAKILKHNLEICQHILLGFTSDGQHLLSYSSEVDDDSTEGDIGELFSSTRPSRCTLHWWKLPLHGYGLSKVQELRVFDGCVYNGSYSLDFVEVPGTDWIVSHTWMCSQSDATTSLYDTSDVMCCLSVSQNPLKQLRCYEIVFTYSKSISTSVIRLPLALAIPGCVIVDMTYCICVLCYDSTFAGCFGNQCRQPWLVNRMEKYSNCKEGLVVWETVTAYVCCDDQLNSSQSSTTPLCIGQQVLDIEQWLMSELSEYLEDQTIGFHFIKDYLVHVQEVCSVTDTISLLLQALVNGRHGGGVKCYKLVINGMWDVKKGEICVKDKTFTECSYSGVLKAPDPTECCDEARVLRFHPLTSAPMTTGTSLLQLSHPYLPLDIVLTSVKSLYTRELDY